MTVRNANGGEALNKLPHPVPQQTAVEGLECKHREQRRRLNRPHHRFRVPSVTTDKLLLSLCVVIAVGLGLRALFRVGSGGRIQRAYRANKSIMMW